MLDGAAELARWQPVLAQLPGLRQVIVRDAGRLPGRRAVPELGRLRRAGPPPAGRPAGRGRPPGSPPSARTTRPPCCTPRARPATPRASSSPTPASLYEVVAVDAAGNARLRVRWVSYLPLAHIAERMFTLYLAIYIGWHVLLLPQRLGRADRPPWARSSRPRSSACRGSGRRSRPASRRCSRPSRTRAGGPRWRRHGHRPALRARAASTASSTPAELAAEFARAEEAVLEPIRSLLGLGEAEIVVSAAAPLPPEVGDVLRRARPADPRRVRDDRDDRRVHHQHPGRVQARHRRPAGARHRGADRRGRRDPDPRAAEHPRLPQPARADRRADRRRRLAAHRGHRRAGRGRLPVRGGPEEGADHHAGGENVVARPRSRTCWSPTRWSARRWPTATGGRTWSRC